MLGWSVVTAGVDQAVTLQRSPALDRLRGLAIGCMVVDHVALLLGGLDVVRLSVGRLALPLFFLIAGHLAARITFERATSWRHLGIATLGLLLPVVVSWVDSPNVLILWAAGCLLLWGWRRLGLPAWGLVVVALTCAANGLVFQAGRSFGILEVWALMALGSTLPRSSFGWGGRLPAFLGAVGRRPVLWYVGHLLVLDFGVWAATRGLAGLG